MWAPTRPKLIDPKPPFWEIEECRRCCDGIVEMSYGVRFCRSCWWAQARNAYEFNPEKHSVNSYDDLLRWGGWAREAIAALPAVDEEVEQAFERSLAVNRPPRRKIEPRFKPRG